MDDYLAIAATQIEADEGYRTHPYRDTEGLLTIGIGRNLEHRGLRDDEVRYLFKNDLKTAAQDAMAYAGNAWILLTEPRKAVIVNMAFNLGYARLAAFKKLQDALSRGDYESAAYHMQNSKWFTQVGKRAQRLVQAMRAG